MKLRLGFILTFVCALSARADFDDVMRRQLGQMIMHGFHGTTPEDDGVKAVADLISKGRLGGVILFRHNIESPAQLKNLTNYLHAAAKDGEPLLIAVDQEGGKVQRLTKAAGFRGFDSAHDMAMKTDAASASYIYEEMAHELADHGINFNFAPVVDLGRNKDSKIIYQYGRSFSADPKEVSEYAKGFILAHRSARVFTALKHWPGHGSSADDSHLGMVDVTNTWHADERIPYADTIAAGVVDAIMTAHVFHRDIDPEKPATLSKQHIQKELREKLDYQGVVITDCLQMGAIGAMFSSRTESAALEAIMAGADIALIGNFYAGDYGFVERLAQAVAARAQTDGREIRKRLCESSGRVGKLKQAIGGKAASETSCISTKDEL
jgi:beta-N-acetylhexosaminidase